MFTDVYHGISVLIQAAFQDHPWYLFAFNYLCELSFYVEVSNLHITATFNILIKSDRTKTPL